MESRSGVRMAGIALAAVGALLAGCMDDYAELPLEEARGVAEEQGRPVVIVWTPSEEVPPRTVISATEGVDGAVRLRVSSGDLVPVPDLSGLGADEAEVAVEELSLRVIRRADLSRSGPFDVVTRTDPYTDEQVSPIRARNEPVQRWSYDLGGARRSSPHRVAVGSPWSGLTRSSRPSGTARTMAPGEADG